MTAACNLRRGCYRRGMAANPNTQTPPVVDGRLAENWQRQSAVQDKLASAKLSLARATGAPMSYQHRQRVCTMPMADLLAYAQATIEASTEERFYLAGSGWTSRTDIQHQLDRWHELQVQLQALRAEAAPDEDLYEARRWSRFFLVQNTGGHIHSSMHCSTCHPTTRFSWLPDLSGLTEADAVAAHGPLLCSVCYPTAPVEWTLGVTEAQAAKAAARCPGSGQYAPTEALNAHRRYAHCPQCGEYVSITSGYKLRAHQRPQDDQGTTAQADTPAAAAATTKEGTMATTAKKGAAKKSGAKEKKPQLTLAQVEAEMADTKDAFDAYYVAYYAEPRDEAGMAANKAGKSTYWRHYNDPRVKAKRDKARAAKKAKAEKAEQAKAAKRAKAAPAPEPTVEPTAEAQDPQDA